MLVGFGDYFLYNPVVYRCPKDQKWGAQRRKDKIAKNLEDNILKVREVKQGDLLEGIEGPFKDVIEHVSEHGNPNGWFKLQACHQYLKELTTGKESFVPTKEDKAALEKFVGASAQIEDMI